ncbi:hypothetical protein CLAFUW4_13284 [Fulvia fulva]|uniref:Uncharacterized protein n=1 Tax=Passalora fulva TaxID=5499 RepID=A0A9Q8PIW2_PASFU|nr:uncharacterized protein CLAFUR5_13139 [Fulvia fulva]KAK4611798.1 hypothetical protein CLAFUR4_13289 [Fulvia fulva]KAK4613071.1 hypothetical protein CLAFUR0_13294 [Fulvia fulva]UJO23310.1 hypothetical protein CLAFUR5_13139 [Fulvia fulva]WPV21399.1 hypothetical protein CLAFUW4_13284 [Fulvia fulva]WPV36556.1 hypothetical protein CLAFUW7_13291 [Fulvia fulva]
MCNYRYRVWKCGCKERFLTDECSYAGGRGHTLHKDRKRSDKDGRGGCPGGCGRPSSANSSSSSPSSSHGARPAPKPAKDILSDEGTAKVVGKLALGVVKTVTAK